LDGEYEILDVVEGIGNRSGMAGNFVLRLDDERTFKSNIKGSHSYLKELLSDRLTLICKMATIKYFNLTPRGVPRFPVAIAVRDYE
jgi:DNA ligase 1